MKKNIYRTIAIWIVLIFTAIYVYPTLGWLSLSEEARQARLAKWKAEDSVYTPPSFTGDIKKAVKRWGEFDRTKVVNLGLDLQGGVHMVLQFQLTPELKKEGYSDEYVQQSVLRTIQRRVNEFEAKEPIIQAMGKNHIQIQLPGERDIDRATDLITKTAYLTFHINAGPDETVRAFEAIKKNPRFDKRFTPFLKAPSMRGGQFRIPKDEIENIKMVVGEINTTQGVLPEGKVLALSQPPNPWDPQEYEIYLIDKTPLMSGEGLTRAMSMRDHDNPGKFQISFQWNAAAARKFGQVTESNIGKSMAIVLDDVVASAPTIQSKITSSGQITGNFSAESAQDLAIALNSGSMPVPIQIAYKGIIGPSLGQDSIESGFKASVWGLALVILFMAVYYRLGGLIANVALFLNGFILLATFAYFGLTLTLPGIAGFVLTLGMAVDANVLIFERIREEVRNGKSLVASIELGYQRATVTIIDSNLTTLIAALVMLQFGTGPVQGFGVALALGIGTSVFTALVVTKSIFDLLIRHKWLKKLPMMSVIPTDTKIPFIEWRNHAFVASAIILVIGLGAFFYRGMDVFGVDFAGGTSMLARIQTTQPIEVGQVRGALDEAGFENNVVQEYGDETGTVPNAFAIRTGELAENAATGSEIDIESRVRQALAPLAGAAADPSTVTLDKVESVGPAIGRQLQLDALKAVAFSLIFMIAYMWFRYNFVYGVTGVIALLHDSIVALGLIALTGRHIDMNVVAAILTIIGYSINDTVVIYDRIREDMRLYAGRGIPLMQVINSAINQTLSRTIFTSFVTLLTVFTLFIFGGPVLNDFAFCLIAGMLAGVYSTVFIATSLAYLWMNFRRKKQAAGAGKSNVSQQRRRPKDSKSSEVTA